MLGFWQDEGWREEVFVLYVHAAISIVQPSLFPFHPSFSHLKTLNTSTHISSYLLPLIVHAHCVHDFSCLIMWDRDEKTKRM